MFYTFHFKDGKPLSSKRNGVGIGTISIQDITEKYKGTVQYELKENIFYTSVLLRFKIK